MIAGGGAALALLLWLPCVVVLRVYTNSWAVKVPGGPEEAERIARKFGFINMGQVMHGSGRLEAICDTLTLAVSRYIGVYVATSIFVLHGY